MPKSKHEPKGETTVKQPPHISVVGGTENGLDLPEKIKELVRLAQEQGHLTYNDVNEVLPENVVTPEILDEVFLKLRGMEIEVVDQAEIDRVKTADIDEEEIPHLDALDDPVRMYLKQMGQ